MTDLQTLRAATDISLAVAKQAPLSDLLTSQQYPPANLTYKSEKETFVFLHTLQRRCPNPTPSYIRTTFSTGGHLAGKKKYLRVKVGVFISSAGTAAMASRSLGGVVDSSLKVYGTSNLRVVDASVLPLLVGAHLQATVYAISERVRHL
jgi:choline dehydrogenase-like flavoprotein